MKPYRLMIVLVQVLVALLILWGCCTPPKINSVGVRLIPQQRDWWCWAASTEMVSEYYIGALKGIPQCQSASYIHNKNYDPDVDCCTGCTGNCPCWGQNWGASIGDIKNNWTHWNFDYTYINANLPWEDGDKDDVKDTLSSTPFCKKSPIYVVWWWYPNPGWSGGHVVTIYGYAEIGADHYVSYYNPLPESCDNSTGTCTSVAGGEDVVSTYAAFADDGVHKWGDTFYNFKYKGQ
jgi:hypothetical protein